MMFSLICCTVPRRTAHMMAPIRGLCFMKCLSCLIKKGHLKNQPHAILRHINMHALEYKYNCLSFMLVKGLQTTGGDSRCWKCGSEMSNIQLFCKNCSVLQAPKENCSLFEVLQIETSYEISIPTMTSTYRQLQNILHPDRYVNSSEEEKRISEEYSSLLNKAYTTLTSPLKRALYMLELRDVLIQEDSIQSPEFLMEVMEKNEELAETEDVDSVKRLDNENRRLLELLSREVGEAFKENDLSKAKEAVIKMKYYTTFSEKIKELKIRLGIVE